MEQLTLRFAKHKSMRPPIYPRGYEIDVHLMTIVKKLSFCRVYELSNGGYLMSFFPQQKNIQNNC